jgi:hypothetical protein
VDDLSGMAGGHVEGWGLVAGNDGSGRVLKWVGVFFSGRDNGTLTFRDWSSGTASSDRILTRCR